MTVGFVYAWKPNKSQIARRNQTVGVERKTGIGLAGSVPSVPCPSSIGINRQWATAGLPAANPANTCYLHCNTLYNGAQVPHHYPLSVLSSICNLCHHNKQWHKSVEVIAICTPLCFPVSLNCEIFKREDGVNNIHAFA